MINVFNRIFRKRRASSKDLIERNALKINEAWAVIHGVEKNQGLGPDQEFGKIYVRDLQGRVWMHEGADCNFVKAVDLNHFARRIEKQGFINPVWWVAKKEGVELPDWSTKSAEEEYYASL